MITRKIITEKWKQYDYIDQFGNRIWLNKYGDIIKTEDQFGGYHIQYKGNTFLEAGYVWAPYLPMVETPVQTTLVEMVINASNTISRYTDKLSSANYIVCSADVANFIDTYGPDNLTDYLPVTINKEDVIMDYNKSK